MKASSFDIEDLGQRVAQVLLGLGQPEGVDVGPDQVLVGQVKTRQADGSGDHQLLAAEEILVVGVPRGAVGQHQSRLAAPPGPAAPLGVVRGGRRHVPHVDHVELADVDAKLHRGRAIEDRELAATEVLLALLALLVGNLGRVLVGLEPATVARDRAIELHEERVGAAAFVGQVGNPDRVVKRLVAVASVPGHAGCRDAVAWNSIIASFGASDSTTNWAFPRTRNRSMQIWSRSLTLSL